jgi:hypothetical protein
MYYTGVGSHKIDEIPSQKLMDAVIIAKTLESWKFILRSGGAEGFDRAFESGVVNTKNMVIYSQDTKFNVNDDLWHKAVDIALRNHPYPENAKKYIRWIGRNPFQVLGDRLDEPSSFLICWTNNGKDIGGTGTTMRVAKEFGVPIYNLHDMSREEILKDIYEKYVLVDENEAESEL